MRGRYPPRLWAVAIAALMTVPIVLGDSSVRGAGPEETSWSTWHGNMRHSGLGTNNAGANMGGLAWFYPFDASPRYQNWGAGTPSIDPNGTMYLSRIYSNQIIAVDRDGHLAWTIDTGDSIMYGGAPTISDEGIILFRVGGNLTALFPNGTLWWRFEPNTPFSTGLVIGGDGTIYIGCENSTLCAISSQGHEMWNRTLNATDFHTLSLSNDGKLIFVAGKSTDVRLVSVYSNGTVDWNVQIPNGDNAMAPCIAEDGSILIYDDRDKLCKFRSDGTLDWTLPIRHREEGNHSRLRPYMAAIGPDGTIYAGSYEGLFALTPDGTIKWRLDSFFPVFSPIVSADGIIFAPVNGDLWAVDSDGELLWMHFPSRYGHRSSVTDQLAMGINGTIIHATYEGIFAINGQPPEHPDDTTVLEAIALPLATVSIIVGVFLIVTRSKWKKRPPTQ